MKFKLLISFFFSALFMGISVSGNSQIKKEYLKLGFTFGKGAQDKFPFNADDYIHEVDFYKIQINYRFKDKKKWAFELNLEPSFNVVEHQLLNKFYVKPSDAENFQELRDLYTQKRTIKEYVLNCGIIARYKVYKDFSAFSVFSLGPMIADKATERLAKGFAFSDILGVGVSYELNKLQFDFRYSVRHTSNLEFQQPNGGHNTTNFEISALYKL